MEKIYDLLRWTFCKYLFRDVRFKPLSLFFFVTKLKITLKILILTSFILVTFKAIWDISRNGGVIKESVVGAHTHVHTHTHTHTKYLRNKHHAQKKRQDSSLSVIIRKKSLIIIIYLVVPNCKCWYEQKKKKWEWRERKKITVWWSLKTSSSSSSSLLLSSSSSSSWKSESDSTRWWVGDSEWPESTWTGLTLGSKSPDWPKSLDVMEQPESMLSEHPDPEPCTENKCE